MRSFLALLLFMPAMAQATPPQVVAVSETLVGVNDTHIFVLRELSDNMGRYQPTQTDIVLIARTREGNRDDRVWPVLRTLDAGAEDFGLEERLEVLPLAERVNPFDVLLWRKARPMMIGAGEPTETFPTNWHDFRTTETGVTVTSRDQGVFTLTFAEISGSITQSLNATRDTMPPYFAEGDVDSLRDVVLVPSRDCSFGRFHLLHDIGYKPHWLIHAECDGFEVDAGSVSMFLTVPRVADYSP